MGFPGWNVIARARFLPQVKPSFSVAFGESSVSVLVGGPTCSWIVILSTRGTSPMDVAVSSMVSPGLSATLFDVRVSMFIGSVWSRP